MTEGNYTLNYTNDPDWNLTTDSIEYSLLVDSFNSYTNLNFGFYPNSHDNELTLSLTSNIVRCNQESKFYVDAMNSGTTILDGILWLNVDTNILDTAFTEMPDTFINKYKFGWFYTDLLPGETINKSFSLKIPGISNNFTLGDSVSIDLKSFANSQYSLDTFNFNYSPIVRCSYDPNDKQTYPNRFGEENLTLFNEQIVYTIRFQNTGNDTAFNINIIDTLSPFLNSESVQIISSSHMQNLKTSLISNEILKFSFENILLPDSNVNFAKSQGYITYSVNLIENLQEKDELFNTAYIYFDSNPAIVTNTTLNTLVSKLDNFNTSLEFYYNENNLVNIYPNPTKNKFLIYFNNKDFEYSLEISNTSGKIVFVSDNNNNSKQAKEVNTINWERGVYFIKLFDKSKNINIIKKIVILP